MVSKGTCDEFPGSEKFTGMGPREPVTKPVKADQSIQRWQSTEGAGRRYDAYDLRTEHNDCSGTPGTMAS